MDIQASYKNKDVKKFEKYNNALQTWAKMAEWN